MPLDEKAIANVYTKYSGTLSDSEKSNEPQMLQHSAYKELSGVLSHAQYYGLLRKFMEITVNTFANKTELPPDLKREWVAQGMPDIRKFVWEKWSREVFKLVQDDEEPRRIFISVDCVTKN